MTTFNIDFDTNTTAREEIIEIKERILADPEISSSIQNINISDEMSDNQIIQFGILLVSSSGLTMILSKILTKYFGFVKKLSIPCKGEVMTFEGEVHQDKILEIIKALEDC